MPSTIVLPFRNAITGAAMSLLTRDTPFPLFCAIVEWASESAAMTLFGKTAIPVVLRTRVLAVTFNRASPKLGWKSIPAAPFPSIVVRVTITLGLIAMSIPSEPLSRIRLSSIRTSPPKLSAMPAPDILLITQFETRRRAPNV